MNGSKRHCPIDPDLKALIDRIGRVGTTAECEEADFVICGVDSFFDDDIHTKCSHCGAAIVHRPYVPKTPRKICVACCKLQMEAENLPHA
ncbi:hypothetical protein LCGC14_0795550 [marine sediment metagenome]|uniref:Uncharacterized protein n=2 Tax=root TaxID=1 RepID=A0A9C9NH92_9HYPH|nr:hypothetical protein [Aurantimonas coralicida]